MDLNQDTRVVIIPSDRIWFDPRTLLVTCKQTVRDVIPDTDNPYVIAKGDPNRVMVGFVLLSPIGINTKIAPWQDVNTAGVNILTTGVPVWFKIFDYFTLVNNDWYVGGGNGLTFRVIEITRV